MTYSEASHYLLQRTSGILEWGEFKNYDQTLPVSMSDAIADYFIFEVSRSSPEEAMSLSLRLAEAMNDILEAGDNSARDFIANTIESMQGSNKAIELLRLAAPERLASKIFVVVNNVPTKDL